MTDPQEAIPYEFEGLDPDSPLLARVQARLEQQLLRAHERIGLDIAEEDKRLQQVLHEKEELGVRLFGTQQGLAKLQMAIDRSASALAENVRKRQQAEGSISQLLESESTAKSDKERRVSELNQQLTELNRLNSELKQVETHSRELLAKRDTTERAAARAAEEAKVVGQKKQEQDFLVDGLNEQLKALQDRIGMITQQIQAQKLDNASVASLLAEAATEMGSLALQRKKRNSEWQANVAMFEKMNEALAQSNEKARQRRAELSALDSEINGFKAREKSAQEQREQIATVEARVKNETELLDRRISDDISARDKVAAELGQAQKALEALEQQLPMMTKKSAQLRTQSTSLQREGDRLVTEAVELGERTSAAIREQQAHGKTAQHSETTAVKIAETIQSKLVQRAQLENQVAQARVESLTVQASLAELAVELEENARTVKQREELSAKYEAEIRRHNDEIQRKQCEVDRLNRKIEQLLGRTREENTGPLEATIHNLGQEIATKQRQCQELESFWLRTQSELVTLQRETQERQEVARELQSRHAVLEQKQNRLESANLTHIRESKELERSITIIQRDVERLNALVSKSASKKAALSSENAAMATEARAALEEMQARLFQLEQGVQEAIMEKETAAVRTVELEEEILQWEKKIRLWQEAQAAIDPREGAAETAQMQHDIRNLEVQQGRLVRERERLVQEMERCVERRGAEIVRSAPKKQMQGETARFQARRLLSDLGKSAKQMRDENTQLENAITAMTQEIQDAKGQVEEEDAQQNELERNYSYLARTANEAGIAKQKAAADVTRYQQLTKRYASMDTASKVESRIAIVEKEWSKVTEKAARIRDLFIELETKFPELSEEIHSILKPYQTTLESASRR